MKPQQLALERPLCPRFSAVLTLALSLSLAACGGGGADDGNGGGQTDPLNLTVDATNGSDDNPGTADAPFKTITHALSVVAPTGLVKVRSGLYDSANGELFPLSLPAGVRLVGNIFFNNKPMIVGAGLLPAALAANESATLVPGIDSTVAGLHLMSPPGAPGLRHSVIAAAFSGATITACVVEQGTFGIRMMNDAVGLTIRLTRVTGASIGILFDFGGHNSVVERSTARSNITGVHVQGPVFGVDLGGGLQSSKGSNILAGNADVDLFVANGNTLSARDNFWDGTPDPEDYVGSNPPVGIDVWRRGPQAAVDTSGALSDEPSNNPLQQDVPTSGELADG